MKRLYKIAAISLAALLVATLCSCGQKADSLPPASNSPSSDVSTPGSGGTISKISSSMSSTESTDVAPTSNAEADELSSLATAQNADAMNAYKDVLFNNTTFFSTDNNESMTLNQSLNAFIDYSFPMTISHFAIIDLDNEGIPEVILSLNIGVKILHYQDGSIYGYDLVDRAFMDLKTDGSFSFSSGSADNGFGTISFTSTGYKINEIAYSKSNIDSNGNVNVSYYINQKSATMEEFHEAVNQEKDKPYEIWYNYTNSNIETQFSISNVEDMPLDSNNVDSSLNNGDGIICLDIDNDGIIEKTEYVEGQNILRITKNTQLLVEVNLYDYGVTFNATGMHNVLYYYEYVFDLADKIFLHFYTSTFIGDGEDGKRYTSVFENYFEINGGQLNLTDSVEYTLVKDYSESLPQKMDIKLNGQKIDSLDSIETKYTKIENTYYEIPY